MVTYRVMVPRTPAVESNGQGLEKKKGGDENQEARR